MAGVKISNLPAGSTIKMGVRTFTIVNSSGYAIFSGSSSRYHNGEENQTYATSLLHSNGVSYINGLTSEQKSMLQTFSYTYTQGTVSTSLGSGSGYVVAAGVKDIHSSPPTASYPKVSNRVANISSYISGKSFITRDQRSEKDSSGNIVGYNSSFYYHQSSCSCNGYHVGTGTYSTLYIVKFNPSKYVYLSGADYVIENPNTPPTTPTISDSTITALNASSTKFTVYYSSTDAQGDVITYTFEYRLYNGSSWGNWITSTTTQKNTSKTFTTGSYTKVQYRVKATDSNGASSGYSSTWTDTIPVYNTAPTQPGTPNVTITNVTSTTNTCTVSWTASTDSNNDTIYYSLYYSLYNGSSWTSDTYLSKNTTTSRSINVSTSGYTKVRFKVYATDNIADAVASSYGQATLKHYPTITSSTSSNLGTFTTNSTIPSITYTVSDTDTETVTVKEYLNGTLVTTRSPYLSNSSTTYTYTYSSSDWIKLPNGTYTVKLEVTDSNEVPQSITRTFTKKVTTIDFIAVVRSSISTCPTKIRINLNKKQLGGNILTCKVCNNGNDEVPNWEDCTPHVLMHKNYYFKNQLKTADTYCIKLRITLDKGTALSTTISAISGLKGRWI